MRRMRANMNACFERKRQRALSVLGRVPLDQMNAGMGYPISLLSNQL